MMTLPLQPSCWTEYPVWDIWVTQGTAAASNQIAVTTSDALSIIKSWTMLTSLASDLVLNIMKWRTRSLPADTQHYWEDTSAVIKGTSNKISWACLTPKKQCVLTPACYLNSQSQTPVTSPPWIFIFPSHSSVTQLFDTVRYPVKGHSTTNGFSDVDLHGRLHGPAGKCNILQTPFNHLVWKTSL